MKFSVALSFLASFVGTAVAQADVALPTQTYFVPIPDQMVYEQVMIKLNNEDYIREPPVTHILAISISTDKTVIWFDHWEDGYDLDVTNATASSTKIWGDGKASNGCAPIVTSCSDANDILKAGNNILLRNNVPIPRNARNIFYDGGDRIQASFPVMVTRAGHPHKTAVLASAIQALDTTQWGVTYEAPVGVDFGLTNPSYEWSIFAYQAGYNDTVITLPNMTNVTMNMGESGYYVVNQGDQIASSKPIQVILITGDIDPNVRSSKPETRWFGIRSVQQYAKSYITPVGDTLGKSRCLIYNPNPDDITYTMKYLNNGALTTLTQTVNSKKAAYSPVVPYNSGALYESTHPFVALSITDSEEYNSNGVQTYAATYDWGFPATPTNLLTPEVLIGLGWGCLNNQCGNTIARSVVWVTPVEDADIYVDYKNNGVTTLFQVKALQSIRFTDPSDKDMSGATIFATQPGATKTGQPVDISVAWGQDPTLANKVDWKLSMDMGTVVLPLSVVNVAKLVDKTTVKANEELEYTIRISNSGQKHVYSNTLRLMDTLDPEVSYIAKSAYMVTNAGVTTAIVDGATGTPYPFDETGYLVPIDLARRGSYIDFFFKVKVAADFIGDKEAIVNNGILKKLYDESESTFTAISQIEYEPAITVVNTVANGGDDSMCEFGEESIAGRNGTDIVYCFNIVNVGNSYLNNITLENVAIDFYNTTTGITLAPGESKMIAVISQIVTNLTNTIIVSGQPSLKDGTAIYGQNAVVATDPSSVEIRTGIDGDGRNGDIIPLGKCLEDNWMSAGNTDGLVCASKEVYIASSLEAQDASTCTPGDSITLTVDANIILTGPRSDIGWYVASDGGDALVGECFTNGFNEVVGGYNVMDVTTGTNTVGAVQWESAAAYDACGDVVLSGDNTAAQIRIPLLVNATLRCADENDDGVLDFATCFNWKSTGDETCSLAASIPGDNKGCFCTRVDVANIEVIRIVNATIKAC